MEFLDKLGKKASEAYKITADKTGKIAKEAKIKIKMSELKTEINEIYEEIGKTVYERHIREQNYDITKEIEEKCIKIDLLSDEIEVCLNQCRELKNKKQCPKCYTEMDKDAKFCSECGEKQEIEEVMEEEVIDNQDLQENNVNENNSTKGNNEKEDSQSEEKTNLERTVEIESDVKLDEDETVENLQIENSNE